MLKENVRVGMKVECVEDSLENITPGTVLTVKGFAGANVISFEETWCALLAREIIQYNEATVSTSPIYQEVEVRLGSGCEWYTRVLVAVLPESAKARYVCVDNKDLHDYREGKEYSTFTWPHMRTINTVDTEETKQFEKFLKVLEDNKDLFIKLANKQC